MEATIQAVLVLVSAWSLNHGFTQSQASVPTNAVYVYQGQFFEKFPVLWTHSRRFAGLLVSLCHLGVIILSQFSGSSRPNSWMNAICPRPSPDAAHILSQPTPLFIAGTILMVLGGLLRGWCFKTLGRHFTLKVTLTSDHTLITSGPYAYVRHPSYTGAFMTYLAMILLYFSQGSYLTECGIMETPLQVFVWYWQMTVVVATFSLTRRTYVEDELLKEAFGSKWVAYSEKVPYRLVPFVF